MKEILHFEILVNVILLPTFFEVSNKTWSYVNDHSIRSEIQVGPKVDIQYIIYSILIIVYLLLAHPVYQSAQS